MLLILVASYNQFHGVPITLTFALHLSLKSQPYNHKRIYNYLDF